MTFGLTTWRANHSVAMTGANKAGIFIEALVLPANATASNKVYTDVPAGSLFYITAQNPQILTITVDSDGAGHARVNWSQANVYPNTGIQQTNIILLIFAKKINTTPFGMKIYNDDLDMALDITYPVPQYFGTYQPAKATMYGTYTTPDSKYIITEHTVQIPTSSKTRIALVNVQNSAIGNPFFYSFDLTTITANAADVVNGVKQNYVTGTLRIARVGGSYVIPTIHVFSLDAPVSGGGTFGLQYHDANHNLVYDSSAENISISLYQTITYQDTSNQTTLSSMPASPGMAIPYFMFNQYSSQPADVNGNTVVENISYGFVCRINSTLYWQNINTKNQYYTGSPPSNYQQGLAQNNTFPIVDISQLNPSGISAS